MADSSNRDLDSSNEMDDDMAPYQTAGPPNVPPRRNRRNQEQQDDDDSAESPLPPRRQHKYTTANLQPERPWMRYFLSCLACLVMIAIMVLISLFLQKLFDPEEEPDWSDDAVNITDDDQAGAVSGASMKLPKDSAYIENVCAEDKLEGATRAACEAACAPALDCCNPYSGTKNSTCFEEEVAGCVAYSQCHTLEGTNDPAYRQLDRLCSIASLEFSRADCEQACETLSCCHTDTDSCVALYFQACLDYSPCQNLRITADKPDTYIPVAPPALEQECRDGDGECGRTCRDATCCSDTTSDCYRDNFVACLTYATCNQYPDSTTRITVAPMYTRVEPAADNLRNVCLESYVASSGTAECEAACAPGECCFAFGVDSCFGDDPLGCLEYRGCSILTSGR